jgi:Plavaka transposase
MEYTVFVKDGMKWLQDLVTNPDLNEEWQWYAYHKFLHADGKETRLMDDPLSADAAWDFEVHIQWNFMT